LPRSGTGAPVSTRKPVDGCAVILHLIEAARDFRRHFPLSEAARTLHHWVEELDRFIEQAAPADEPVGWEPRRWRELMTGDTVSLGGVEAVVESAMVQQWHVDPNSNEYRPQPLEHEIVALRLKDREPLYRMPPDGEVETLRGELGQTFDRRQGRGRDGVDEHRAAVIGGWADEAMQTLKAAGLQSERVQ
jgi:hypothetical protein